MKNRTKVLEKEIDNLFKERSNVLRSAQVRANNLAGKIRECEIRIEESKRCQ